MDAKRAVWLLSQMFLIQFDKEEHEALGMAIDALNENAALKARLDNAVELPFIAMIEQCLDNGKFAKSAQQKFNGRYCVVYFDKSKWGSPLIDICGLRPYSSDEAQAKLDEMKGGADKCNG